MDASDTARDVASLRCELDAAREALSAMRVEHQQELIAVRQGWRGRCDELSRALTSLRSQQAAASPAPSAEDDGPMGGQNACDNVPLTTSRPRQRAVGNGAGRAHRCRRLAGGAGGSGGRDTTQQLATNAGAAEGAGAAGAGVGGVGGEGSVGSVSSTGGKGAGAHWREDADGSVEGESPSRAELLAQTRALSEALREAEAEAAAAHAAAKREASARRTEVAHAATAAARVLDQAAAALGGVTDVVRCHAMTQLQVETGRDQLLDCWCGAAEALAAELALLQPAHAQQESAEVEFRRAMSSVEGRLQLEQERHSQQLERLTFENDELRRATRVKTEKIALLRTQLAEAKGVR